MIGRVFARALWCGLVILGAGCTTPSHLVFHQSTVLGVDVSGNTSSGQAHVVLAYDRQTDALIPKTKTSVTPRQTNGRPAAAREENEAMATLSASKITIKWFGAHEVNEQFATGEAAVNIARSPEAVASLSTLSEVKEEKAK